MEVILVKQVRKLGSVGNIINVKRGFARNFLIPQGFALASTTANKKVFEQNKEEFAAQNAENKKQAEKLAESLSGKDVAFIRQAAIDGKLFGSITSKEIAKKLLEEGHKVHYSHIYLNEAIKHLGVVEVTLHLHSDVNAYIVVNVARSEAEAMEALNNYKNPNVATTEEKSEQPDLEAVEEKSEQPDLA